MKTVSLDEVTYGRLFAYRASLEIHSRRCPDLYPKWMRQGRVSLDDAISFLLDHQERKGERVKEYRRRKAERAKEVPCSPEEPWRDGDILSLPPEPPPTAA